MVRPQRTLSLLYLSVQVMPHQSYWLTPSRQGDFMEGIDTDDILALTDHITGRQRIDNPYLLIAADINNSGSISLFDIIHLRKGILGMIDAFPNNQNWRFIPASFIFPDAENPWATSFPEQDLINDMPMPDLWANFYAIKIGDLNNGLINSQARNLPEAVELRLENYYL